MSYDEATLKAVSGFVDNEDGNGYVAQDCWPVDFVEIHVANTDPSRLTNHFHNFTLESNVEVGTHEYVAASSLLSFSSVSNELEAKDNSLDISLSGVDQETIALVLGNPVEGSRIYVTRGFYNAALGKLVSDPVPRWSGRVISFSIQDDYRFSAEDSIVVTVSCKSLLSTLLERVTGRYTSVAGYNQHLQNYDTPITEDNSMEFVSSLTYFNPDFGKGQWQPSGGGGGKHLCTRYWEFGDITDEAFEADCGYRAEVDDELYNWYSDWAKPLADSIEKGTIKYYICKPFVRAWSQSMSYKMGVTDKRSRFGEFLEWLGVLLSR